ncbi:MAG: MarR family winged helix-turn-helix transcriptional regulator [Clostridiaceae bacterium]
MKNDSGLKISSLLKDINYQLNNRLRAAFKHSDFTVPQITALQILYANEKMTLSALSHEMRLANSTVSGIVDRLEKLELVERIRSREDKRQVYLALSSKNEYLKEHIHNAVNDYLSTLTSKASQEEIDAILKGLNILNDLLSR